MQQPKLANSADETAAHRRRRARRIGTVSAILAALLVGLWIISLTSGFEYATRADYWIVRLGMGRVDLQRYVKGEAPNNGGWDRYSLRLAERARTIGWGRTIGLHWPYFVVDYEDDVTLKYWAVFFPLWMPLVLALAVTTCAFLVAHRYRPRTGYCRKCGYCLTGVAADVCPECGTKHAEIRRTAQSDAPTP